MARVSDLLLQMGELQGQRASARSRERANLYGLAGDFVSGVQQRQAAQHAARMEEDDRALRRRADEAQIANAEDQIAGRQQDRLDEQQARELAAKTTRINEWLSDIASDQNTERQRTVYGAGREQLIAEGVITEQDAPTMWPGQSWVRSRMAMTLPAAERFKQMFPEAEKPQPLMNLGPRGVFDPASRSIVEGTAAPPEPPKPPADFNDALIAAHAKGDSAEVDRILTLMRRSAEAGRAPQAAAQPPTPQQDWVIRGGIVTPIARGTAQPGDEPFDPVAARQTNTTADPEEARRTTESALALARRARTHGGLGASQGIVSSRLTGWTQGAEDFRGIRDQLVAYLTLPNLGALKGPMSDKDVVFVKQLATRLANDRLSDEETGRAIDEAIVFLESKLGTRATTDAVVEQPQSPARGAGPGPSGRRVNPFR